MTHISRRDFLKVSALTASALFISTGLTACGDDDKKDLNVSFDHGIASGDPLSDKVIIWTRVTHIDDIEDDVSVSFEVATDSEFKNITNSGALTTAKDQDYTVKVDVQKLTPATKYYYRFKSNGKTTTTGVAKTLPTENPQQVKMAVFTCANYPNGYFNAYTEAAKIDDLDVTIHVGDYIYEYGMYEDDDFTAKIPAYATKNAQSIGRTLPEDNNRELLVLDDYRKRYALYHTDSGTQAIHAAAAMIVVWDDHEIANDAYKDGAQNHNADDGDFTQRTNDALQAYFEWLPIRPITNQKEIYRSFDFGNLVSLHMLETRIFGRDKQLNYLDYYKPEFDIASFMTDLTSPTRTMLGADQLSWLQGKLQSSTSTWQVLGQQVLMGKMNLPAELLTPIGQLEYADDATKATLVEQINTMLGEFAVLKMRLLQNDPTLTEEELARVGTTMPYNLDAWDGYFIEREMVLGAAKTLNKNLVVLSGDTHNAWASNLKDIEGNQVGVEFATTSVTSPGLEDYIGLQSVEQSMLFEGALGVLIDDLKYANTYDRGYMVVTFTADSVESKWHYVDNYDSDSYALNSTREKIITVTRDGNPLEIG